MKDGREDGGRKEVEIRGGLTGTGLGGTSLINANVFMEADKKTLAMNAWPPQIRDNVDVLDECK